MKQSLTVRQEGNRVIMLVNGRRVAEMPWEASLNVGKAFIAQGRKAEEHDKANLIIPDQALCQRLCLPFGISSHPLIQKEAWKMSQHMPGVPVGNQGIGPTSVVGTPSLISHPPRS